MSNHVHNYLRNVYGLNSNRPQRPSLPRQRLKPTRLPTLQSMYRAGTALDTRSILERLMQQREGMSVRPVTGDDIMNHIKSRRPGSLWSEIKRIGFDIYD